MVLLSCNKDEHNQVLKQQTSQVIVNQARPDLNELRHSSTPNLRQTKDFKHFQTVFRNENIKHLLRNLKKTWKDTKKSQSPANTSLGPLDFKKAIQRNSELKQETELLRKTKLSPSKKGLPPKPVAHQNLMADRSRADIRNLVPMSRSAQVSPAKTPDKITEKSENQSGKAQRNGPRNCQLQTLIAALEIVHPKKPQGPERQESAA